MNSEIRELCRELKGKGWTTDEISRESGVGYQTVAKHVKGVNDLRYTAAKEATDIAVGSDKQHKDAVEAESSRESIVHNYDKNIHNYGKNIHKYPRNYAGNYDNYTDNYTAKIRKKTNTGGYIVVWFVVTLIVLFLLDHFVFEGKMLAYIRSYFSKEPEEREEKVNEEEYKTFGFEGRSLEEIEEI